MILRGLINRCPLVFNDLVTIINFIIKKIITYCPKSTIFYNSIYNSYSIVRKIFIQYVFKLMNIKINKFNN